MTLATTLTRHSYLSITSLCMQGHIHNKEHVHIYTVITYVDTSMVWSHNKHSQDSYCFVTIVTDIVFNILFPHIPSPSYLHKRIHSNWHRYSTSSCTHIAHCYLPSKGSRGREAGEEIKDKKEIPLVIHILVCDLWLGISIGVVDKSIERLVQPLAQEYFKCCPSREGRSSQLSHNNVKMAHL